MAFDIMQLFAPGALNRLLQPQQNAQGVQNFLANPQQAQQAAPPLGEAVTVPQAAQVAEQLFADPWAGMREQDVVRPDMMQTGAVQQQPAQQPAQRPGFGLGIDKAALNDIFTGWAMGSSPSESIAKGAQLVAANRGTRQNVNQTVDWLKGKGMDEQQARMLASSPPALNEYLKTIAAGNDPQKALQLEKTQLEINKLRQGRPENYTPLTAEEKSHLGLDPAKAYQRGADNRISEIGGNGTVVNVEAPKLPSGYRFVDRQNPDAGVEPIPGGPATQLPGELAARVGMADNWLNNDLPELKKRVSSGEVTGVVDRFRAANSSNSPQAEVYRKVQSGVEVLSRLLSGAGMTQVEIDEKAARYMPTYTDDAASMGTKLNQLEAELKATRDSAMAGRGGPIRGQETRTADPLGIR